MADSYSQRDHPTVGKALPIAWGLALRQMLSLAIVRLWESTFVFSLHLVRARLAYCCGDFIETNACVNLHIDSTQALTSALETMQFHTAGEVAVDTKVLCHFKRYRN